MARKTYNQLLYNPFAKTNTPPKIADGREFLSSGIRLQAVDEISCTVSTAKPTFYIAVIPGLSNGVFAWQDGETTQKILPYKNHFVGTAVAGSGTPPGAATGTQTNDQTIAKWRLVSQGIRFQLLNNSDENEGWFEMIRYQLYPSKISLSLENATAAPSTMAVVRSGNNFLPGFDPTSTATLCEHPTYTTGKLRHMNRMIFKHFANTGDHDFIPVPTVLDMTNDANKLVDLSFDCLLFKIHPRTVDPSTSQPTKLLCHIISNQEIVYDESSTLSRYMTPNGMARQGGTTSVGNPYSGG